MFCAKFGKWLLTPRPPSSKKIWSIGTIFPQRIKIRRFIQNSKRTYSRHFNANKQKSRCSSVRARCIRRGTQRKKKITVRFFFSGFFLWDPVCIQKDNESFFFVFFPLRATATATGHNKAHFLNIPGGGRKRIERGRRSFPACYT